MRRGSGDERQIPTHCRRAGRGARVEHTRLRRTTEGGVSAPRLWRLPGDGGVQGLSSSGTVPQGGSVASIGFASFGCRGAGERRYHCEVASGNVRRDRGRCGTQGTGIQLPLGLEQGNRPKRRKTAPTRTTPAPPSTATPGRSRSAFSHACRPRTRLWWTTRRLSLLRRPSSAHHEARPDRRSLEQHRTAPESHTVHVAPGVYEVAYRTERGGWPVFFSIEPRVTVVAGQEQEVRLTMNVE